MPRHTRSPERRWLVYCLVNLGILSAPIQTYAASTQEVSALVTHYLQTATKDQTGAVSISVAALDERQRTLEPCTKMQAFLPQGQLARGRVTVGVRCVEGPNASLYVSAKVKIEGAYIKLARPISGGQVIGASDLQIEQGELSAHPADLVLTLQDAVGQVTRQALSPGQALRSSYLKTNSSILAGQSVKVIARGSGFSVLNNGRALQSASLGGLTRVKLDNGQIVTGIAAEAGIVDVSNTR